MFELKLALAYVMRYIWAHKGQRQTLASYWQKKLVTTPFYFNETIRMPSNPWLQHFHSSYEEKYTKFVQSTMANS